MFGRKVLKIKRGKLSREFDMLKVAKAGDVGIDLPVALPYKQDWEVDLRNYLDQCRDLTPDYNTINEIKHGYITINPGERHLLPTDIKLEIPKGYWVAVEARSSTSKQSLIVPKGVIDEGYRGEIFAQIINVGDKPVIIHHGDRLVQMILQKNETNNLKIKEVSKLSKSERGESGFGSSGKSAIR